MIHQALLLQARQASRQALTLQRPPQVWERHYDLDHKVFYWYCRITDVTRWEVPTQGQEDPDYDKLVKFRKYHVDDVYARIAADAADATTAYSGGGTTLEGSEWSDDDYDMVEDGTPAPPKPKLPNAFIE